MDKFDIIGIIGEGTYGQVYKAKDKDTGKGATWLQVDPTSPRLRYRGCAQNTPLVVVVVPGNDECL